MKFNETVEEILNEILDSKYKVSKVPTSDKRKNIKYKATMGKYTLTFEGTYDSTYNGNNKKFESKPVYNMRFGRADESIKTNNKVEQFFRWLFQTDVEDNKKGSVPYKDFDEYKWGIQPSLIQIFGAFKSVIEQFFKDYPNAILMIYIPDIGGNDNLRKSIQKLTKKFGKDYNIEFSKQDNMIITKGI